MLYAVPIFVIGGYWQHDLLVRSETTAGAEAATKAAIAQLALSGLKDASERLGIGRAVPLPEFSNRA